MDTSAEQLFPEGHAPHLVGTDGSHICGELSPCPNTMKKPLLVGIGGGYIFRELLLHKPKGREMTGDCKALVVKNTSMSVHICLLSRNRRWIRCYREISGGLGRCWRGIGGGLGAIEE